MIGKTFSHYKILEEIGTGGMGIIYKAEDTKLNRIVALKFLHSHLMASEEEKSRFVHEAKAAAALSYSNICTVYEIDEHDKQTFIAMEYIEGQSLNDKITDRPLKLEEALDIAIQVAIGLQKAHDKLIIHRDIKPANILLSNDGVVKIVDFGLAKLSGQTKLTKDGSTLGTVAYMSPEQTRGEEVDSRTDIWSLGIVLYEMITGQLPFKGDYEQAIVYSILNEEPEPLTGLRIGVPMELERIVNKSLAKNPDERYQHVDELLVDCQRIVKDIELKVPSKPTEVVEKLKRRKLFKKVSIPVGIAMLLVLTFFIIKSLNYTSVPSIVVPPFKNLSADEEQEYFCNGIAVQITHALTHVGTERLIIKNPMSAFSFKDKDIQEIGKELNVDYVLDGSVSKEGDQLRIWTHLIKVTNSNQLWSNQYDRNMEDIFDIQDDISMAIVDSLKVKLLGEEKAAILKRYTENVEAYELYLNGTHSLRLLTTEGIENASKYFTQSLQIDSTFALAHFGLGLIYISYAQFGNVPPKKVYPVAKDHIKKALEIDPTLGKAHGGLGIILMQYDWDWKAAEQELKLALQLNPNSDIIHLYYSWFLSFTGRHEEAIDVIRRAQELDPRSNFINIMVAHILNQGGRFDEALRESKKTVKMFPNYHLAHTTLGACYRYNSMFDSAVVELKRSNELSGGGGAYLARAYYMAGDKENGDKLFKKLKDREKQGEYILPTNFFVIHDGRGDLDSMFYYLEKAYEDKDSWLLWILSMPVITDLDKKLCSHKRFKSLRERVGLE